MNQQRMVKPLWYVIISFLVTYIVLPFLYQAILLAYLVILEISNIEIERNSISAILLWCLSMSLPLGLGYLYGKVKQQPKNRLVQYGPILFPLIYTLVLWCIAMFIGQGSFADSHFAVLLLFGLAPFFLLGFFSAITGFFELLLFAPIGIFACFFIGFTWANWRHKKGRMSKKLWVIASTIIILLSITLSYQFYLRDQRVITSHFRAETLTEFDDLSSYQPFSKSNKLVPLRELSKLHIDDHFPKLDGATAFFPVYAAAVQAIYATPKTDKEYQSIKNIVRSSRTPNAYARLIAGDVDLIFVAAPSQAQIEEAKKQGLTFKMVPLAREAFVFLVSAQNPVNSLTVEQIQAIYSGQITNWQKVGGENSHIMAYQRPNGSGSQSTMIKKVMQGIPLKQPLIEEMKQGMGGLVQHVANYRNDNSALGYSFRYYVTNMRNNTQVKLLSINGIAPTVDNIRNGSYPFIANVYMVTARPVSTNTQQLMDWFVSEQGQQLIKDVGYVSLIN